MRERIVSFAVAQRCDRREVLRGAKCFSVYGEVAAKTALKDFADNMLSVEPPENKAANDCISSQG